MSTWSAYDPIGVLYVSAPRRPQKAQTNTARPTRGAEPEKFEQDLLEALRGNVIGNIHFFNLCMPLVLQGRVKKVISISTGMADADVSAKWEIDDSTSYSISKAALNMAVSKFSAQYAKDGVLFISIAPGVIDTGLANNGKSRPGWASDTSLTGVIATDEQKQKLGVKFGKFQQYNPTFSGPTPIEVAIQQVLSVINKSSVEAGDGGSFVSQHGNKQWL